jgi:hypothetical protein
MTECMVSGQLERERERGYESSEAPGKRGVRIKESEKKPSDKGQWQSVGQWWWTGIARVNGRV